MDMLKIEKEHLNKNVTLIAGIDEAGRGPLAGPVVAACVIFERGIVIEGINDSKKLTPKKRDVLFDIIKAKAKNIGIGVVHENKIDEINILQATYLAMKISLGNMNLKPDLVLIDGPSSNIKHYNVKHIINGDSKSQSIAAASIIAKVTRDRIMLQYDIVYPEYKFCNHKGYGTKYHIETIKEIKSSPIHRKSFKIVNESLPSYAFIKEKYGFLVLGKQIVISKYIKNDFVILNKILETDQNNLFDFIIKKDKEYIVIKVLIQSNNDSSQQNEYFKNIKYIKEYLEQKDMRINFTFNVISVTFQKGKKPITKIIYNKIIKND